MYTSNKSIFSVYGISSACYNNNNNNNLIRSSLSLLLNIIGRVYCGLYLSKVANETQCRMHFCVSVENEWNGSAITMRVPVPVPVPDAAFSKDKHNFVSFLSSFCFVR